MSKLSDRLTRQLASKGLKDAKSMAFALLKKQGNMNANGTLTAKGESSS